MEAILQGFQLFQAGGPVMYLLLACSLFVGYIAIERALFYGNMADPLKRFYRNTNIHNVFILRMCPVTVMV